MKHFIEFVKCLHPVGGWLGWIAALVVIGVVTTEFLPMWVAMLIGGVVGAMWPTRFDSLEFNKRTGVWL